MTLQEKIKVMRHFEKGGQIQYRNDGADEWLECRRPLWNWSVFKYREMPKTPGEIWVNEYAGGKNYAHFDKKEAELYCHTSCIRCAVKYREVIEGESDA